MPTGIYAGSRWAKTEEEHPMVTLDLSTLQATLEPETVTPPQS